MICNTDAQALAGCVDSNATLVQLGSSVTMGLGAGGDSSVGRESATENLGEVVDAIVKSDTNLVSMCIYVYVAVFQKRHCKH